MYHFHLVSTIIKIKNDSLLIENDINSIGINSDEEMAIFSL